MHNANGPVILMLRAYLTVLAVAYQPLFQINIFTPNFVHHISSPSVMKQTSYRILWKTWIGSMKSDEVCAVTCFIMFIIM